MYVGFLTVHGSKDFEEESEITMVNSHNHKDEFSNVMLRECIKKRGACVSFS